MIEPCSKIKDKNNSKNSFTDDCEGQLKHSALKQLFLPGILMTCSIAPAAAAYQIASLRRELTRRVIYWQLNVSWLGGMYVCSFNTTKSEIGKERCKRLKIYQFVLLYCLQLLNGLSGHRQQNFVLKTICVVSPFVPLERDTPNPDQVPLPTPVQRFIWFQLQATNQMFNNK